jgi:two-component system, LuxR family, response regulator FixJ
MHVIIVDDDAEVRLATSELLSSVGLVVRALPSGEALLAEPNLDPSVVVLLDLRMDGLGGLATLERLRARGGRNPVVVVTGRADVPSAVASMRLGAVDLIEKPYSAQVLIEKVQELVRAAREREAAGDRVRALRARFEALSPREIEVLRGLLTGHANKVIAYDLEISIRTVEVHRANIMRKTGFDSLAELVQAWFAVHPEELPGNA